MKFADLNVYPKNNVNSARAEIQIVNFSRVFFILSALLRIPSVEYNGTTLMSHHIGMSQAGFKLRTF